MNTIIHISADFPDPIVPGKTAAVANLLAATPGFRHIVYSLNRTHKRGVSSHAFRQRPYGHRLWRPTLWHWSGELSQARHGVNPARSGRARYSPRPHSRSQVFGRRPCRSGRRTPQQCPFICSLWGDTDIRIFEIKRGLRSRYRAVAAAAQALLPAAPWTGQYFQSALQIPGDKINLLPVMTAADAVLSPTVTGSAKLVSLFHLDLVEAQRLRATRQGWTTSGASRSGSDN